MESFTGDNPVYEGIAPGRLDVMGGISDYSGSWVLEKTIKERTKVFFQEADNDFIEVESHTSDEDPGTFKIKLEDCRDKEVSSLRENILRHEGGDWAIYVTGCMIILNKYIKFPLLAGKFYIESDIPLGKGVSSSAALEVATMVALLRSRDFKLDKKELPRLAQKVENEIVGAPCGIMDQMTTYLGMADHLLPIQCQPDIVKEPVNIPDDLHFCGIDSGVKHFVSGASYGDVRAAAFMGYSVIAQMEGANIKQLENAKEKQDWSSLPYKGYLSNINPSDFIKKYADKLPVAIKGKDFIDKYKISIDKVTSIDPATTYNIRVCTQHPVFENMRVKQFYHLLNYLNLFNNDLNEEILKEMGELMCQSHESYSLCGLGNEKTDKIVQLTKERGIEKHVYGGRITGGGSGGTVCILCHGEKGINTAKEISYEIGKQYDFYSMFFEGSSDGGFHT